MELRQVAEYAARIGALKHELVSEFGEDVIESCTAEYLPESELVFCRLEFKQSPGSSELIKAYAEKFLGKIAVLECNNLDAKDSIFNPENVDERGLESRRKFQPLHHDDLGFSNEASERFITLAQGAPVENGNEISRQAPTGVEDSLVYAKSLEQFLARWVEGVDKAELQNFFLRGIYDFVRLSEDDIDTKYDKIVAKYDECRSGKVSSGSYLENLDEPWRKQYFVLDGLKWIEHLEQYSKLHPQSETTEPYSNDVGTFIEQYDLACAGQELQLPWSDRPNTIRLIDNNVVVHRQVETVVDPAIKETRVGRLKRNIQNTIIKGL